MSDDRKAIDQIPAIARVPNDPRSRAIREWEKFIEAVSKLNASGVDRALDDRLDEYHRVNAITTLATALDHGRALLRDLRQVR